MNENEKTYGQLTLEILKEYFPNSGKNPVPQQFWDYRNESDKRKRIFAKAGVSLENGTNGWVADISAVTAETLDQARKDVNDWDNGAGERRDRLNATMRRNERAYRRSRGW